MTAFDTVSPRRIQLADPRVWFGVDAGVTAVNAVGYVLLGSWLVEILGGSEPVLRWIGAGLLLFAGALASTAATRRSQPELRWTLVAINAVWVLASLAVSGFGWLDLSTTGRTWVALQAVVVGTLCVLQSRTLRSSQARP